MRTQHAFILKKIEKILLLCHLTRRYNQPSLARTTPHGLELIFVVPKVFEPIKFELSQVMLSELQ